MVINVLLDQTKATAGVVPAFPAYIGDVDHATVATPGAQKKVSATENIASGVYTKFTQEYVDIQGVPQDVGAAAYNFVRYCEYPGQRLFKKVKFEVNGEFRR